MARTAQINVNINTQKAIKSIDDLNNEIGGVITTVGDLRMTVDSLTQELESTEFGTERFNELKAALIDANTQLKNYELSIEALDHEQVASEIGSVVGGLTDMVGGLTLLGVSGENVEKIAQTFAQVEGAGRAVVGTIEAYQSAQKLANTLSGVGVKVQAALSAVFTTQAAATGGATAATRVLGMAMNALPILAIIGGITAIVVALNSFNNETEVTEEQINGMNSALEKMSNRMKDEYSKSVSDYSKEMKDLERQMKRNELTDEEYSEASIKQAKNRQDFLEMEIKAFQGVYNEKKKILDEFSDAIVSGDMTMEEANSKLYNRFGVTINGMKKQLGEIRALNNTRREEYEKLTDFLIDKEVEVTKSSEEELLKQREQYKKHLELLFMIQNQSAINRLDEEKRTLRDLNESEGTSLFERLDQLRKAAQLEKDIVNQRYDFQIKQAKGNADQIKLIELQRVNELSKIDDNYTQEAKKLSKERTQAVEKDVDDLVDVVKLKELKLPPFNTTETKLSLEELMQEISAITDQAFSAINGIAMSISDLTSTQMENDSIAREAQYEKETEALQSQLANRLISEEEFESKMQTLQADKERQELIAKRKAFQQDKQIRIAQATMSMAQAIIAGMAAGFPMGIVMAALAGVTGAIQIAAIKQQQFRAAKGGVVPGQPSNTDSVDALLAPGEVVINSQSAGMFPQTLSAINQIGGGVSLAPEVPLVPGTTSVFEANRTEQRPMIKTYVVSSEIKEGLDTDERIRAGATF
jgi:hypothetical protein